jgi:hypothetical protein
MTALRTVGWVVAALMVVAMGYSAVMSIRYWPVIGV